VRLSRGGGGLLELKHYTCMPNEWIEFTSDSFSMCFYFSSTGHVRCLGHSLRARWVDCDSIIKPLSLNHYTVYWKKMKQFYLWRFLPVLYFFFYRACALSRPFSARLVDCHSIIKSLELNHSTCILHEGLKFTSACFSVVFFTFLLQGMCAVSVIFWDDR